MFATKKFMYTYKENGRNFEVTFYILCTRTDITCILGGVKKVRIPLEKGSEKSRGFAYIEFKDRISHNVSCKANHITNRYYIILIIL